MHCRSCGRPFHDGDDAYEHDERTIRVRGGKITWIDTTFLLCAACEDTIPKPRRRRREPSTDAQTP